MTEHDDFATGADYAAEGFPRDPDRSPAWLAGYDQFHRDYDACYIAPHLTREQAEYMALVAPTEAAS